MINKDLIYLVNAPNDEGMASIANYHCFPALGILSLGTWLTKRIPELEVIVRDGGVHDKEKILEDINKFKPGIIGVSVLCTSYKNSLEIANAGKDNGATIIFGNDQAAHLSKSILQKRPHIDYVIGAEYGEFDLELLVRYLRKEKIDISDIETLTYRDNGGCIKGFDYSKHKEKLSIINKGLNRKTALDIFPIPDRTLYPKKHWEKYLENYLSKYSELHKQSVLGVTTINRARGCNRQHNDKCKHCDMLLDISSSSPEIFWEEVRTAHTQVKATSFYECCDSFSSFPGLIKRILVEKPSNLGFNPEFYVYAQAIDLADHPERIDMLKEIGVFRVNIGLESMSDKTLKHMKGEKDSVKKNYQCLYSLKDRGIYVYASFVLGSEAENRHTLRETVTNIKRIIDEGLLVDFEAQPILPLLQNYQGKQLIENKYLRDEELESDLPWHSENTDDLSEIYINNFSGVSFKEVLDACIELKEYGEKSKIRWSSGVLKENKYVPA